MKVSVAIKKRRSIRKYNSDRVDKKSIIEILEAGRFAPSAKNRQPWSFVVVDFDTKSKIGDLLINKDLDFGDESDYGYSSSIKYTGEVIKNAPVLILIYTIEDENYLISDTLSVGACIENMILKATELSLGTLWIRDTTHVEKEISSLVGTSKKLSSALLIGNPSFIPNERPRKSLDEITKWL